LQVIEGNALAFTNPAIEAALVHCRALLEFLGLSAKNENTLAQENQQEAMMLLLSISRDQRTNCEK
jgi:BarA-like signal transduction histidine kinase